MEYFNYWQQFSQEHQDHGATIIGGLLIGLSRPNAAEFTFYLAIPTMLGASLLKLVKFGFGFTGIELIILLVGKSIILNHFDIIELF